MDLGPKSIPRRFDVGPVRGLKYGKIVWAVISRIMFSKSSKVKDNSNSALLTSESPSTNLCQGVEMLQFGRP